MFGMKPLHRTYVYRAVLIMANGGVSTVWVRGGVRFMYLLHAAQHGNAVHSQGVFQ